MTKISLFERSDRAAGRFEIIPAGAPVVVLSTVDSVRFLTGTA